MPCQVKGKEGELKTMTQLRQKIAKLYGLRKE
jgi:hypothetical protein